MAKEKRVEELKKRRRNTGKRKKQVLKKDKQVRGLRENEEMQVPEPPKIEGKTNSFLDNVRNVFRTAPEEIQENSLHPKNPTKKQKVFFDFKKRMNRFNLPKIKLSKHKTAEEKQGLKIEEDKKKTLEIKNPAIREFFRAPEKKELKKEEIAVEKLSSEEKNDLFEELKRLEDKMGKSREEIEELQRIKNMFYSGKKEIRNIVSSNSEVSEDIIEKEKSREEFSTKIINLVSKIHAEEKKRREMEERKKRLKETKGQDGSKKTFLSLFSRTSPKKEKVVIERIPSAEKHEIFENLKRLDEKIDKNKEEVYNRVIMEAAESKRMIEAEKEEIKKQMIELLAESIDKLDTRDREIKEELYEELQRIKSRFYGEKKEIRNIVSSNSEESRKIIENEKEKIKEEFLTKIAHLRNKINAEEKKAREMEGENKRIEELKEMTENIGKKEKPTLKKSDQTESKKKEETNLEKEPEETNESKINKKTFSSLFSNLNGPHKKSEPKPVVIKKADTEEKEDIITSIPELPKFPDLELPKYPEINNLEEYDTKKFTRKIETQGDYEKSIKNLIAPKTMSQSDLEFEKTIQKEIKKGIDNATKKKSDKKHANSEIVNVPSVISKKSVYIGEPDFKNAREEIEKTKKSVNSFEKNFSEKAQIEKREHEKISRILEDAEKIRVNFSKITSGVLGKVRI